MSPGRDVRYGTEGDDRGIKYPVTRFSILAISSDPSALPNIVAALEGRGHGVRAASSAKQALSVPPGWADLMLLHLPVRDMDGAELLGRLRGREETVPIVVGGSDASLSGPLDAREHGGQEYVADILADTPRLLSVIGVALGARQSDRHLRYLRWRDRAHDHVRILEGDSEPIRDLQRKVRALLDDDAPAVLLSGERGAGKGLLARHLHHEGARRVHPFVELPCGVIPEDRLAAELFGSEHGEVVSSVPRAGLFGTADRGTLFIDGADALPERIQEAVLYVVTERRLTRVGATRPVPVDVQVIVSFHQGPGEQPSGPLAAGLSGPDGAPHLRVPSLRERGDETVAIAERLLTMLAIDQGVGPRRLSMGAREVISAHDWPGNLLELRNVIERVILADTGEVVQADHLHLPPAPLEVEPVGGHLEVRLPWQGFALADLEREVLREALDRSGGNVTRAARFLGISRQTLIYRIKKHGLSEFVAGRRSHPPSMD